MTSRPVNRRAAAGAGAAASLESRALRRLGTLLRGKYRIERVLGAGGMATVYAAVAPQRRTGSPSRSSTRSVSFHGDIRARFLREGYVANRVGHPGAVRVLDDDVAEDGAAFLVMELLRGRDAPRARAGAPAGGSRAARCWRSAAQLLDVLAAAHARGRRPPRRQAGQPVPDDRPRAQGARLRHRPRRRRARRARDATGARLGTPAFMPPELALGRQRATSTGAPTSGPTGAALFTLISGQHRPRRPRPPRRSPCAPPRRRRARSPTRRPDAPARGRRGRRPRAPLPARGPLADRAARCARRSTRRTGALHGEPVSPTPSARCPRRAATGGVGTRAVSPPWPRRIRRTRHGSTTLPQTRADASARPSHGDASRGRDRAQPARRLSQRPRPEGPRAGRRRAAARPAPARRRRPAWRAAMLAASALLAGGPRRRGLLAPGAAARARVLLSASASAAAAPRGRAARRATAPASAGTAARPPSAARTTASASRSRPTPAACSPRPATSGTTRPCGSARCGRTGVARPEHYGPRAANAVELARRDFAETAGGLPPARPGGPRRPIGGRPLRRPRERRRASAAHLVDDVRVPAVLGFAIQQGGARPRHLALPPGGRARRRRHRHRDQDPRHPPRARRAAPRLARDDRRPTRREPRRWPPSLAQSSSRSSAPPGPLRPGEPIRVALLRHDSLVGQASARSRVAALRYNGKSVAENGDAFRLIARGDFRSPAATSRPTNERTARAVVAFRPHVVDRHAAATRRCSPPSSARWPASAPLPPALPQRGHLERPRRGVLDWTRDGALPPRLRVDADGATTPPLVRFALRYNEVFTPRATPANAPSTPYDAFYLVAYAAAALGAEPDHRPAPSPAPSPASCRPASPSRSAPAASTPRSSRSRPAATSTSRAPRARSISIPRRARPPPRGSSTASPRGRRRPRRRRIESGLTLDARTGKLVGTKRCP